MSIYKGSEETEGSIGLRIGNHVSSTSHCRKCQYISILRYPATDLSEKRKRMSLFFDVYSQKSIKKIMTRNCRALRFSQFEAISRLQNVLTSSKLISSKFNNPSCISLCKILEWRNYQSKTIVHHQ